MDSTYVTVQMSKEDAEFLETYAREHATSVAAIFSRYARRLKSTARHLPHPKNVEFTGSIPADVDVREEYGKSLVDKHR